MIATQVERTVDAYHTKAATAFLPNWQTRGVIVLVPPSVPDLQDEVVSATLPSAPHCRDFFSSGEPANEDTDPVRLKPFAGDGCCVPVFAGSKLSRRKDLSRS